MVLQHGLQRTVLRETPIIGFDIREIIMTQRDILISFVAFVGNNIQMVHYRDNIIVIEALHFNSQDLVLTVALTLE